MIKTLFGAALCAAASLAHAAWPERPVKLVVPYAAGGAADALARVVATELGSRLKQQVIVENKAGAGGTIGAQSVAQAPRWLHLPLRRDLVRRQPEPVPETQLQLCPRLDAGRAGGAHPLRPRHRKS
jgi:hypothetical protein